MESTKTCIRCGRELPATTEYFRLTSEGRMRGDCRDCHNKENREYFARNREKTLARNRQYRQTNPERVHAVQRASYQKHRAARRLSYFQRYWSDPEKQRSRRRRNFGMKLCAYCKKWFPATTEYFTRNKGGLFGLYSLCRSCGKANARQQYHTAEGKAKKKAYQNRPDVVARRKALAKVRYSTPEARARLKAYRARPEQKARRRAYSQTERVKEKMRAFHRAYRQTEHRKEYMRKWNRSPHRKAWEKKYAPRHKEIIKRWRKSMKGQLSNRVRAIRRRTRERELPCDFNSSDWDFALEYFGFCCAACGRPRGLWHTLAMDHWIPMNDPACPGTVPDNILPLCHGEDGCNNSKSSRNPEEWLIGKFGKRKAKAILKRIQEYFKIVRNRDA